MKLSTFSTLSCLLCIALGVMGFVVSSGSRPLSSTAMVAEARGAAPGDCTQNYSWCPCTENGETHCWEDDSDFYGCTERACVGCSAQVPISELCSPGKPWNGVCTAGTQAGGCGFIMDAAFSKCQFDDMTCNCRCFTLNLTNIVCDKNTAEGPHTACFYVP
jgi:hypothetical protein